jgi:hypothetical protein
LPSGGIVPAGKVVEYPISVHLGLKPPVYQAEMKNDSFYSYSNGFLIDEAFRRKQ